jgi:hypothetical protein
MPGLTFGAKPERIADESATSAASRFVHRNISYDDSRLTIVTGGIACQIGVHYREALTPEFTRPQTARRSPKESNR